MKDKNKRVSAKEAIELYIPEKVKMKYKEKMRKRKKKDGGDGDVKDVVNDNNCNNSNNGVSNSNNDNKEHVNASDVNSNNVNKQEELFRKSQIGSAGMFIRKQLHMQQTQRKFNMHRKTLKNFTKLSTTTQENFIRITNKTNISRHLNDNNNNNNNSNSNNSNNNNNQPIQLQTPLNISNNNTNNQTENQRYLPPSQPKTTTNTIINQKIQTLNSFFNHTNTFNHNINTDVPANHTFSKPVRIPITVGRMQTITRKKASSQLSL